MAEQPTPAYLDTALAPERRAADLVARMTLEEKVSQMVHDAPVVERLGVPAYNWWNECLHGVARAGKATVFPQAIGMAASFDTTLLRRVAVAISDEARAKHHQALQQHNRCQYMGLTFWSPNINLFRDPRWGRGHETYGEDPYLTSRLAVAFIRGLQGDDATYLKVAACAKHYAVHSGPEGERHRFDAVVSPRDLRETYLPAFRAAVTEAGVEAVMGAYNRTNGEPCCGSRTLLTDILRGEWGFDGHVTSDCWAVQDFHKHHKVTDGEAASAALAVRNGCDLNCGCAFPALLEAVEKGLIDEAAIDAAVARLFVTRFRLGMFDPPERVPFAKTPAEVVACAEHRRLSRRMAQASIVLLKNDADLLPLPKDLKRICVVGPTAARTDVLLGNYFGRAVEYVTLLDGIVAAASCATQIDFVEGCALTGEDASGFAAAADAARAADVVIACMGLAPPLEGEQGDAVDSDAGGDRVHISLPGAQEALLRELHAAGTPVVLVLTGGSALAVGWAAENLPAILFAWYPGERGGAAVADVLFGDYNPAGRLPVTFPKSLDQLPPFEDYAMAGRTYRFMTDEPLYRFGFGLSYTTFEYSRLTLSESDVRAGEPVTAAVDVRNTGRRAGEEVVQLYVRDVEASVPVPRWHLEGFRRVHLAAGETQTVAFALQGGQLACYDDAGRPFVEGGAFAISLGGGQPDDPAAGSVTAELRVV